MQLNTRPAINAVEPFKELHKKYETFAKNLFAYINGSSECPFLILNSDFHNKSFELFCTKVKLSFDFMYDTKNEEHFGALVFSDITNEKTTNIVSYYFDWHSYLSFEPNGQESAIHISNNDAHKWALAQVAAHIMNRRTVENVTARINASS